MKLILNRFGNVNMYNNKFALIQLDSKYCSNGFYLLFETDILIKRGICPMVSKWFTFGKGLHYATKNYYPFLSEIG